jgi:hypothetical protein
MSVVGEMIIENLIIEKEDNTLLNSKKNVYSGQRK